MRRFCVIAMILSSLAAPLVSVAAGNSKSQKPGSSPIYVITDDDNTVQNSLSFFEAGGTMGAPTLTFAFDTATIGQGIGGGFFGLPRVNLLADPSAQCVYASDAGTTFSDIASVNLSTHQLAGSFNGSATDIGDANGIGIVVGANYLYAAFTSSNTIATFAIQPGCQLSFLEDVTAAGLNGGSIAGMALHGNLLVVAYGDGSIESFSVATGLPVSNGDAQNSTGYNTSLNIFFPEGVDITQDGHWAVFGDSSIATNVEVSDISSGHLTPTKLYTIAAQGRSVGPGVNSGSIRLSPDQTMLFLGNSDGGSVSAAFFDANTGKVRGGCTSPPLNGFYNPWAFAGSVVTRDTTGTGGVLYVAEYGFTNSFIGVLNIASDGTNCTLTESSASEVSDPQSSGLLSIAVYPPRSF
jgi:hypothetical protein